MNVFLKLLCVISPTHRQTDRKIERLMLLFCPLCGGLLIINNENDSSAFTCKSCVYTFPIKDKSYSARVELTRKKVDDVLGGEDAWKNVDSTEGKTLLFSNFIFYISLYFQFGFIYQILPYSSPPSLYLLFHFTVTCPKCENTRAYFMQIQIRSADEPSSIFYKCCNNSCGHQWREG